MLILNTCNLPQTMTIALPGKRNDGVLFFYHLLIFIWDPFVMYHTWKPAIKEIKTIIIICKNGQKLGRTNTWHVNTQVCRCPDITQIFNPKMYQVDKLPISCLRLWTSAVVILNLPQLTRIFTFINQIYINVIMSRFHGYTGAHDTQTP